jgi:chromosome segregation ATPase
MNEPISEKVFENSSKTLMAPRPILENISNALPPPTPNPSPSREKLLHEQNLLLSRELKTSNERHITLIQFLKLENLKQEKVIELLSMTNETLRKELTMKEKQINSLTAFVEHSEQSTSEEEKEIEKKEGLNDLEIRLKDANDQNAFLEAELETLRKQKEIFQQQNEDLRSKNLEIMQEIERDRKMLDIQTEGIQRIENERKSLQDRMNHRDHESKLLKKKIKQCESYIKELEKTIGRQSRCMSKRIKRKN